jgi:class 3 adenylate cyclase
MADDTRTDAGSAAYRGFLFSDLRGFTAFAERYGNAAAAEKVRRFLEIARTAIARYKGAEIKTEGDAIHAVFPSASSAVLCGLEIVDAAAELSAQEPDSPLNLGVGVHAGEAVETAEGYIGTAVNVAARLCAAALPGEVLVSSTVKAITQTSIPVGFIARGRRRLKGIHEPVEVYAVTRDLTAGASRTASSNAVLVVAGVGLVLFLVIAVVVGSQLFPSSTAKASPSPSAAPTVQPVVIGPLAIGRYAPGAFQPPMTFDIADPGWSASRDLPDMLALVRDDAPRGSVYFLRVQEVIAMPCSQGGEGGETRPAPADVITELRALTHVSVDAGQPVQVGSLTGQQVDVGVSEGALAACGGVAGQDVSLFVAGKEIWGASPGERFRLISLPVGDQAVTIVLSTDWEQTHSVQEMENLFERGQQIINTVRF